MCSYCGCESIEVIGRFMAEHVEIINASGTLRRACERRDDDAVVAAADAPGADGQLAMADVELANGHPEAAFARLLDVVRAGGDSREPARLRLLELFEAVGPQDPAVLAARRGLMSALF